MTIDETYATEWAYIPHFYYNFYVYQYATSITAAAYFADQILKGGEVERENYLDVLRAGGSDHPHNIFLKAGLDMTTAEPYEALMQRTNRIMDAMEEILRKRS
jgi:oligoendopeptidase F